MENVMVFMESTFLSYVSAILYSCFVFLAKYVAATSFKGTIEYGDGDVIRYANFVPFYNHKLNHSVGETRMVNSEEECIEICTEIEHCLSVNFKTTPKANANKKYICEVLNTDKFNSYDFFVAALDFNHYSFTTPCEHSPCKNGGTCHAVDNWRDFRCDCSPSTRGRTCSEVPYKDCVELLNAGIQNTGVHFILDKSWALPTYCDQDYMGGGWLMVFKVVAGSSHDVEAIWSRDSAHNVAKTSIMNVNSSDKRYYKGRRIGYWENLLKPKEARLALYKKESLVLSLVFNATDSNKTNWFSKSRLLQSPWTEDLQSEQQNFFSLVGDLSTKRAFFINKVNGSCSGDIGWLMVTSGDSCSYETQYWRLSFLYSKLHTRVNWNDHGNVGAADVLAVFIR
ncbi:uncharacterized protein [Montipora capricornis]|uniref:uncharacterized protein n=1 Tax=Montipora capricornis TaxID=246305 RepID=UPI0035F1C92E